MKDLEEYKMGLKKFRNYVKKEPEKTTSLKYLTESPQKAKSIFIKSEIIREKRKIKDEVGKNVRRKRNQKRT